MPEAKYGEMNCWLTVMTIDSNIQSTTPEKLRLALRKREYRVATCLETDAFAAGFQKLVKYFGGEVSENIYNQGIMPSIRHSHVEWRCKKNQPG